MSLTGECTDGLAIKVHGKAFTLGSDAYDMGIWPDSTEAVRKRGIQQGGGVEPAASAFENCHSAITEHGQCIIVAFILETEKQAVAASGWASLWRDLDLGQEVIPVKAGGVHIAPCIHAKIEDVSAVLDVYLGRGIL